VLVPRLLNPAYWATRDFTLGTRLLSEPRIVLDYIRWTILPMPHDLSFYYDHFAVSRNLVTPWQTLPSIAVILALLSAMLLSRKRYPLAALGLGLFFASQSLTATILPLELVYEHRNYFASVGLLLVLATVLKALGDRLVPDGGPRIWRAPGIIAACLLLIWTMETTATAYAWGNPVRLAEELALRAPTSPRAQYELGRSYIVASRYAPLSPYTQAAYRPLEVSASLPGSSTLPEQALIFFNGRMGISIRDGWWTSMIRKLGTMPVGVQDESALLSLSECLQNGRCKYDHDRLDEAFKAALSHGTPSARLNSAYASYAWNVRDDRSTALAFIDRAISQSPAEPMYLVTKVRMETAQGSTAAADATLASLRRLNFGGRLDDDIAGLMESINNLKARKHRDDEAATSSSTRTTRQ
jgi:hypothetical protein